MHFMNLIRELEFFFTRVVPAMAVFLAVLVYFVTIGVYGWTGCHLGVFLGVVALLFLSWATPRLFDWLES